MATLICTKEEFHRFIGPRIRNDIQYLAKKRKNELGYRCESCGEKFKELDAAHRGPSRKDIIDGVLTRYRAGPESDKFRIDLESARKEILDAHKPLEKHISMLRRDRHLKPQANH